MFAQSPAAASGRSGATPRSSSTPRSTATAPPKPPVDQRVTRGAAKRQIDMAKARAMPCPRGLLIETTFHDCMILYSRQPLVLVNGRPQRQQLRCNSCKDIHSVLLLIAIVLCRLRNPRRLQPQCHPPGCACVPLSSPLSHLVRLFLV